MSLTLELHRPGMPPAGTSIGPGVYTIGAAADNRIVLPSPEVSQHHAALMINQDMTASLEDLNSSNGTFINNVQISGRIPLPFNAEINIGNFKLVLRSASAAPASPGPAPAAATPPTPAAQPAQAPKPQAHYTPSSPKAPLSPERQKEIHIKQQIHKELLERLDLKRMTVATAGSDDLNTKAMSAIESIINDVRTKLPPGLDPTRLAKDIYDEALLLGPLEDLLADESVTEIMVNGHDKIFIEQNGKLTLSKKTFVDNSSVLAIIERIVAPLGRRIDESQPYVDARLKDGSRVNAVISPLTLDGPTITIRKFSKTPFTADDLVRFGSMTPHMVDLISACVRMRKNIIVSGGTGSGKTSLLNVVSSFLPSSERIVTIEDAAELRLTQDHLVRLEARPPNIEGKGAVSIRDLVRNSLRMRPDRIVVGECRGGEALDMLQAMNTGHDGSLTTVHANAPRDVISRLETMVLMSGMELPVRAIREQVASAVDLIVHINRFSDGSRKVMKITEVIGLEGDKITMQDIFEYVQTGIDADGKVLGNFRPTGSVPTFIEEMKARGITLPEGMFNPPQWNQGS